MGFFGAINRSKKAHLVIFNGPDASGLLNVFCNYVYTDFKQIAFLTFLNPRLREDTGVDAKSCLKKF